MADSHGNESSDDDGFLLGPYDGVAVEARVREARQLQEAARQPVPIMADGNGNGVNQAVVAPAGANDLSDDESFDEEERAAVVVAMHRAIQEQNQRAEAARQLRLAMQQQAKHLKKMADAVRHHWVRYEFAPGRGQIHAHLLAMQQPVPREDGRG